ncbi:GIY-YIG nuclease family protein [Microbacterium sp. NPDC077644]|uniref:GIY-YIG nuclease family protein n=1 Tax=Microbacterium sp. NPDC077644 TaxID=3155055 RepID=UPI00344F7126
MYVLKCADGSYYTGSTGPDVVARVWEHNHVDEKAAAYTRKRRPVVLVYAEEFDRVDEAYFREKQVQGWSRQKKEALIALRGEDLPRLSKNRSAPPGASTGSATGPRPRDP